jgi:hypothetical protein
MDVHASFRHMPARTEGWTGMEIEVIDVPLKPKQQFVRRRERSAGIHLSLRPVLAAPALRQRRFGADAPCATARGGRV